jgi:hypothetical protein
MDAGGRRGHHRDGTCATGQINDRAGNQRPGTKVPARHFATARRGTARSAGSAPCGPLSDQRKARRLLRLFSMTRAPCRNVIAALGHRSQAAL